MIICTLLNRKINMVCLLQLELGGYRDEDRWADVHEEMVDAMIRLEKALRPYIAKLEI